MANWHWYRNENLHGVPLLVAANKQDLADCMGVREVKPLFEQSVEAIGSREVSEAIFAFIFKV